MPSFSFLEVPTARRSARLTVVTLASLAAGLVVPGVASAHFGTSGPAGASTRSPRRR